MKILFLDDCPYRWKKFKDVNPEADADWAPSFDEGVRLIKENNYDMAYLDHDLDFYAPTGKDFVDYIVNHKITISKLVCHSMNYSGRHSMTSALDDNHYHAINCPFAWKSKVEDIVHEMDIVAIAVKNGDIPLYPNS